MKKILKRLFWFLFIGSALCAVLLGAFVFYLTHDLPKLNQIEDYKPPQATRVYDAQGNVIAEFFIEKRTLIDVADLPPHVKYAFIAAEDADFYNHKGIDYVGVVRALINEVKYKIVGGQRMGGSTITQQTAKLMLLSSKKTYTRKLREMILAQRIEEVLSKDEILNIYLNQIYFGNGAYGIEEAARSYYGVGAKQLTVGQAAALASVPKSPNRLNPLSDPERARGRRDYVLDQMVSNGFISNAYAQAARKEAIEAKEIPNPYLDIAPYFAEDIRRTLVEKFGEEAVFYKGLSVYTSLNSDLQKAANTAMTTGLRAVDKRQGYRGPLARVESNKLAQMRSALAATKKTLFGKSDALKAWNLREFAQLMKDQSAEEAAKKITSESLKRGSIVTAVVKSVSNDAKSVTVDLGSTEGHLPFSKMAWARQFSVEHYTKIPSLPSDVLKSGDIIWVRLEEAGPNPTVSLEQEPLVSGALVSLDVHTGAVISMVGGFDFNNSKFNRATQAKRQPGSSFKPFIYSTAIEKEAVTAATIITDAPKVFFEASQDGNWKPKNNTGRFLGDITVRTCLTRSVNTCSITLLEAVGIDSVRELSAKTGMLTDRTPFPRDLTLALGSAEVIPVDIANAYRIFPNSGRYAPYILFHKVVGQKGEVLFEAKTEETQVLRPETAYITTSILQGLMRGVGKSVTGITQPLAGKTGTTNQFRSAWFSGYSRDVVTTVYVGFDNNQSLGPTEYGYRAALPIWGQYMTEALKEFPATEFPVPENIVWRLIDQRTGMLAGADSDYDDDDDASTAGGDENSDAAPIKRGVVREAFIAGTEPTRSQASSGPPPLEAIESGAIAP